MRLVEVFIIPEGPPPEGLEVKVMQATQGSWVSKARLHQQTVGTVWAREERDDLVVRQAEVEPDLKGKGVGHALYSAMLKKAETMGMGFRSDDDLSPDAIRFWSSLVNKGLARKEGTHFRMRDPDDD